MNLRHLLAIIAFALVAAMAPASGVQIQLTPQTSVSVADQRSTITISAIIYTAGGSLVPDGTQVSFQASAGSFRDPVVTTTQGRAQAVLVAPGTPGTCVVTAMANGSISTTDIEFFSDRSLLNSAKEYIEVYSGTAIVYGAKTKVMTAAAPEGGVHLRYREVSIDADDLQLNVPTYEVRAKHAHVKMGKFDFETPNLYLKLNARKGYAYGKFLAPTVTSVKPKGPWFDPVIQKEDHYGFASIEPSGFKPAEPGMNEDTAFTFASVSDEEVTIIQAKKAIAFPRKEVQFQDAELIVGGAKAMRLPLYRDSMTSTGEVTDQIVTINDNHVTVNYPYYLSLKPGTSSLLRFRTGENYGRGIGASNRVSLDYELNWNQGDDMDGGMVFSGLARKDWDLSFRQYLRFKDDTSMYFNVDTPAGKGLFGSFNANKQFSGMGLSLSAVESRSFTGPHFDSRTISLNAESNPIKAGRDLRFYFGADANTQRTSNDVTGSLNQHGMGATLRAQLLPQHLDKNSTFNLSVRGVRNFSGTEQPYQLAADATISRAISKNFNVLLSYDYINDGFSSKILGQHSLNLNANLDLGNFQFSGYALRSLDADRLTYFFDSSYKFSQRWYLMYSHTFTEFLGDKSLEYYPTLAYNLGGRLIGLTWSNRTKRFGIQLLGAPIN